MTQQAVDLGPILTQRGRKNRLLALIGLCAAVAQPSISSAITFEDPANYRVKNRWTASSLGIPDNLGGLLFTADGATLYVVGASEEDTSALYAVPVTRNPTTNEVVKLGPKSTVVKVFDGDPTIPGLDAGLEFGPDGTLFYTYWNSNYLGQRPGGVAGAETIFPMQPLGVPESIAGLTFSPHLIDPGTGFAQMQVSSWDGDQLFDVPLTPAGGGIFTPGTAVNLVTLPFQGTGAIQYVPTGPLAGNIMYVNWDYGEVRLLIIDAATGLPIDGTTGLPTRGTTDPIDNLFISDLGVGPWGLEFDPLAGDFFLGTFEGDPPNTILQIGGFPPTACSVTRATAWATASKLGRVTFEGIVTDLDISGGLTFRVTDVLTLDQSGSVSSSDCQTRPNGKIKCVFDDPAVRKKRVKAIFTPTAAAGTYNFKISMNKLDVPQPQAGPLSLAISGPGGTICQGSNAKCTNGSTKLVCKNTR